MQISKIYIDVIPCHNKISWQSLILAVAWCCQSVAIIFSINSFNLFHDTKALQNTEIVEAEIEERVK